MGAVIVQILLALIILQIVLVIVLENRNPYKTTSWILVLTFLPVIGLILYLFFGQETRKKYTIRKKLLAGLEAEYPAMFVLEDNHPPIPGYEKVAGMMHNVDQAALLSGNDIRFFSDGKDKFRQFFLDIENARHHVHILYYKIYDDKLGNEFADLLIRKAKEGVAVRLLYDDFGSLKTRTKYFDRLRAGGVEVEVFLKIRFPRLAFSVNYRNHKKQAVIDGRIGYVGGMNIGDCYVDGVSWGVWRDMQIRIEGNGVKGLQRDFLQDWYFMRKSLPEAEGLFPGMENDGSNPLQIVSSGPIDKYSNIEWGIFQAIGLAKKSIHIQTPYFVPSESILTALQTAAVCGVDVYVMMPRKSDNFLLDGANLSFVKDLLRYDIRVYLYDKGFLHSKCTVIDEELTIMGSANMDMRSFELCFETNAFIYDKETARRAVDIFDRDAGDSIRVEPETWKRRHFGRRLFESVMRLFTPLL